MTAKVGNDVVLPIDGVLHRQLSSFARTGRIGMIAGIPAVGKSLYVQQLALLAAGADRTIHTMQWDVVRARFETPEALVSYPSDNGATHPTIRRAVGLWGRQAVSTWHEEHPADEDFLIVEMPLAGSRFIELTRVREDKAEPVLSASSAHVFVPVPTGAVREHIERAREATSSRPRHQREAEDALPNVVVAEWTSLYEAAVTLGIATPSAGPSYDPEIYGAVYRHLLRGRHHSILSVESVLPKTASVYELGVHVSEVLPSQQEVEQTYELLRRSTTDAAIADEVDRWGAP